jgi:four helix bundle protein
MVGWAGVLNRATISHVGSNPTPSAWGDSRERKVESSKVMKNPIYSLLSTLHVPYRIRTMTFAFEKLVVYQKAVDLADDVFTQTKSFSRGYGFIASQLNRAVLSISTNIAEGNGRFSKPDRKRFFGMSRESVQECVSLLELSKRRNLILPEEHQLLKVRLEEISRMLSGLIRRMEGRDEKPEE